MLNYLARRKDFCNWLDGQSKLVKVILCIWILDIVWAIYRIGGAIANKNMLHLILAILWVLMSATVGWILDVVSILLTNHIFWFKE